MLMVLVMIVMVMVINIVMVIGHLHYILWVSEWRSACVWQKAVANVTGHRGHPVHDVDDHVDNGDGIDNK